MSETKSILQQCGFVSNTENNSKPSHYIHNLSEDIQINIWRHNGTKESKNGGDNLGKKNISDILKTFTRKWPNKIRN